jgi:hypothetical protein
MDKNEVSIKKKTKPINTFSYIFRVSGQEKNFNRYNAGQLDYAGGIYDFDSTMHYGNLAFSKNDKPTMMAIKDPSLQFGRTKTLSKTDIIQLNALYDCKSTYIGTWY